MTWPFSRFAVVEDVRSPEFTSLNHMLDDITVRFQLADHSDLNEERYPWSKGRLRKPAFYAARMWEYPFAILSADLRPGMRVADVGCGMTAFTIYLKDRAGCQVTGIDPDAFDSGIKYKGHGVSREFLEHTGLHVVQGNMEALPLETESQDRVFCISVMEHVPPDIRRRGMQEIARILRPGGRAILTVDMSMWFELNRPLDLLWDSGLTLLMPIDLRWPSPRFGMFSDSRLPADVFGMTLLKEDYPVETQYRNGSVVATVPAYQVPTLMNRPASVRRPFWRRAAGWIYRRTRQAFRR
jgi:SAM-dependent methyltransferase